MLGLTLLVASIALADSINPSTVVPALWLATGHARGILMSYTLGVFGVTLIGGLVVLFGPGRALIAVLHDLQGTLESVVETVGGILLLAFAVVLWNTRNRSHDSSRPHHCNTRASAFALGAGIMAIELPTAFMYFGAIAAIVAAHPSAPVALSLLAAYNAIFIAPLLALLVIHHFAGPRTDHWIESIEEWIHRLGQVAFAGVAAVAGVVLLVIGVTEFLGD